MKYFIRLLLILLYLYWCYTMGGSSAVFYGFIAIGLFLFVLYTAFDAWKRLTGGLRPNVTNQTINIENMNAPARRGEPVSRASGDPTAEDWGGLVQSYTHRRIEKGNSNG